MGKETGVYIRSTVAGEEVQAFVPQPLPPRAKMLLSEGVKKLLVEAERNLAQLRIAFELVPNISLFAYAFVRKEAVYSSQIEGIQATLSDLLNFEAAPEEFQANRDVIEVCNYLDALEYGKKQLLDPKGLPFSLRLIRELHKRLMRGVQGSMKAPGEFRTTQNWIGGIRPGKAHFVPPPPNEMMSCLVELEKFLHQPKTNIPDLVRTACIHVQFETIHPFLDGNGRVGRLLIALLLEAWCQLDARLLYLSLFFKQHRQEYYRQLDAVRQNGDWEGWTEFFLEGVCQTAREAVLAAQNIFRLFETDRKRLLRHGSTVIVALRLLEELPNHPVLTISSVTKLLKTTKPTAGKAVDILCELKILEERTGGKRNRVFGYRGYLDALRADEAAIEP
ncbi:MAG: Fic family protein [Deltaproteobacteria bacterium]|nr:Fic family protein [Deltaproteobacteria bacterium]